MDIYQNIDSDFLLDMVLWEILIFIFVLFWNLKVIPN